jgi:hypothetical protein
VRPGDSPVQGVHQALLETPDEVLFIRSGEGQRWAGRFTITPGRVVHEVALADDGTGAPPHLRRQLEL